MAFDLTTAAAPCCAEVRSGARSGSRRRWGVGVAASVLLHVTPLVVAGGLWAARPPVVLPPEQVFEVELVRLQAPPRPLSERPPGPVQAEAAVQQPSPKPRIQPRLQVATVADVEPLRAPQTTPQTAPRNESVAQPQPSTEAMAPPSRDAPPAASASSAAHTWEGRILAHLESRKRYPAEARARRLQGVAYINFIMDRQGRVLSSKLERSSGHPALDREALALLQRAQPLPAPPPETRGERITLTVPVDFYTRGR